MPSERFRCTLAPADRPACADYARVTITDTAGDTARACPRHAVAALTHVDGARVNWADTRGLGEHERKALELTEETAARSLARPGAAQADTEAEAEAEIT